MFQYLDLKIDQIQKKNDKDKIMKNPLYKTCLIPNHPSRTAFIGPSGSGKTNLLISFLVKRQFYKNYFDQIIVFSLTYKSDDNYKKLN